ncbi:hypothetical protein D3C76_1512740 [compost metagenome]
MLGIVRDGSRVEGIIIFSLAVRVVRGCNRRQEVPRVIINGQGNRLSRGVYACSYRTVKIDLSGNGAVGLITQILEICVSQSQNRAKQGNNKHNRRDGG